MVLFKKAKKPGETEIDKEGSEDVLHLNYENYPKIPSIEDDPIVFSSIIEKLASTPNISRIVFHQKKRYEYSVSQTLMLAEIARIYNHFTRQKSILTQAALEVFGPMQDSAYRIRNLQYLVLTLLKSDPVGAFVESKRLLRQENINSKDQSEDHKMKLQPYLAVLNDINTLLANTKLILNSKDYIDGYNVGNREAYKSIFKPMISPDFMYTRLLATPPLDASEIDSYSMDKNTHVQIFNTKETIKPLYHLIPPEFQISEDKYELLDLARKVLSEHQPKAEEFIDSEKMRETFFNIGKDLISELSQHKNIPLSFQEIEELANILVRYTVGFGLVETLLQDEEIQDIAINSPAGSTPIFIVHGKYDECVTNIIPSIEDVDSWASKFRLISARPLDEANPVLDTELSIPAARARVAIIGKPLSPGGLAFSIRRHRDKPWTLPLFIKNNMMNDLAAGLLSFIVDGSRSILVAGTRGSGKTSLLGSVLVEIMRKYRVITVEDSVTGDSELLIKKGNYIEKTTIGELTDSLIAKYGLWYNLSGNEITGNDEGIEILSKNKENKFIWNKPTKFIRHKVKKDIYQIKTRTGRTIKVTKDHSLFSLDENAQIKEIKPTILKKGSFILTPRSIPFKEKPVLSINLLDYLEKINKGIILGKGVKEFNKKNYHEIKLLSKEYKYSKFTFNRWLRLGYLPIKILKDLNALNININKYTEIYFKSSPNSKSISITIGLEEDLLTLIGIWLADGCYDKKSIIFSTFDKEDREVVTKVGKKFSLIPKVHSDGGSFMLNSTTLKFIFREILELNGNAYTKKIPKWVFNLSKEQISYVLKGLFSGDGYIADKEIAIPLSSIQLLKDIQTLLLQFDIIFRIGKFKESDRTYTASISSNKSIRKFRDGINILQTYKKNCLDNLANKISTHDSSDVIPLPLEFKKRLHSLIKDNSLFNITDYVTRDGNLGREKLGKVLQQLELQNIEEIESLKSLYNSDIFWDEVLEINLVDNKEGVYVYDLSVPGYENFVCNNILAHNTKELPVDSLRDLGYNIQDLKVRSALAKGGSELSADEGIRTSLRMGDSSLIVGEVRSTEALALYEAMRTGALANTVAGTIHGDSPYGVYDRVVNDLQVPKTSFKATDIIIIANPIRSADGLHKFRRITQITEVRKEWEDDPLRENGFVDLMRYDSKTDSLIPTEELINGDSEIIKDIASKVKEWSGSWDAIWDNILLRAKLKQTIVDYAKELNNPDLLEAKTVIQMNDEFHRISDRVKQKLGYLDSKQIFFEWEEYFKKYIKLNY